MKHNYHAHTAKCNHAIGSEREYIERAIETGMETLGFSDHAPYPFPDTDYRSGFRMKDDELFSYAETIRALQKEYANDIRILCGFELEYYPKYHAQEMEFLNRVHPDYLLLGQHFTGNEIGAPPAATLCEDKAFSAYITQVLDGLKTGDFLYLAHPDLAGYPFEKETVLREYRRLCEGAKAMHIPLEINFLGLRTKRHYPQKTLFEIAASVGNEVVFGADAHDPKNVFDTASEEIAATWVKELNLHLVEKIV